MGERNSLRSYRDLIVWEKAVNLVVAMYGLTETFPKSEIYGLVSQMRRAQFLSPPISPKAGDAGPSVSSDSFFSTRLGLAPS